MKSIGKLLLTTIVIMLCSCQQPDTSTAKPIDSNVPPMAHRFTFDGHSYIGFKYVKTYSITIMHGPDCECNKNKNMNSKFYVSYEAARLLKEKGYNEEVELFYNTLGELNNVSDMFCCEVADNTQMAKYDYLSAPTKAEAIDWLESKGIVIIVDEYYVIHEEDDYYTSCWGYYIRKNDEHVCRDNSSDYTTRLEAEEAAIIKACELL